MRRLAAIIALLAGASVLAPVTSADAAMRPAGLPAAAAHVGLLMPEIGAAGHSQPLPGGFVLVQYNNEGGGGGGGGGYSRPYNGGGGGYSRPSYGGGYSRQNHGGGNNAVNGAAAVIGIITILRQQQIMQQQQELLKRQQRQQYQYNDHLRQNQARREQELHNERAKENQRKVNLEKARKEERLEEELEETKKQLNDQNRVHNYPPATPQPVPAPVDPYPYHDRIGNIVVNIIPAPDNCPDNFQELKSAPRCFIRAALTSRRTAACAPALRKKGATSRSRARPRRVERANRSVSRVVRRRRRRPSSYRPPRAAVAAIARLRLATVAIAGGQRT